MSDDIPGYIFKIETFIKDLENPDDMVQEKLEFQGIRTNKQLREEYKKRKGMNHDVEKNYYIINTPIFLLNLMLMTFLLLPERSLYLHV